MRTNTAEIIRKAISDMSDEWYNMSDKEKNAAIVNGTWEEFEVATAIRSPNYTLVPIDFCERIAVKIDESAQR